MSHVLTQLGQDTDPAEILDDATALGLAEEGDWADLPAADVALAGAQILAAFGETGRPSLLALAVSLLEDAYERAHDLSADQRSDTALCLGEALREGSVVFGEPEWLPGAIEVGEVAAQEGRHAWVWMALYETYRLAFRTTGVDKYLHEALRCAREAADCAEPKDVSAMASNLGAVLMQVAKDLGNPSLMDEALTVAKVSVRRARLADPNRAVYLSNLAFVQSSLAERDGHIRMARQAVRWATRAVEAEPSSINALLMCANCHETLGELSGDEVAFDEATDLLARADIAARGTPRPPQVVLERSTLARRRFERNGDPEYLIVAARYAERAVVLHGGQGHASPESLLNLAVCRTKLADSGLTGPRTQATRLASLALARVDAADRPQLLENAALVWLSHHERTGSETSLNTAIDLLREATETPSVAPRTRSNLASALLSSIDREPDEALVREATDAARRACAEEPLSSPERAAFEAVLASCLEASFGVSRDLKYLLEAARYARSATRSLHPRSPDSTAVWTNCAVALRTSFEHTGKPADLELAVRLLQKAIVLATPAARPTCLSQLAATLRTRFESLGEPDDLTSALSAATELEGYGAAITRAGAAIISACRMTAYEASGGIEELDGAVLWARTALTRRARIAEVRAAALTSLANALFSRFEVVGEDEDLTEALRRSRQAIRSTPRNSPSLAGRHANLANVVRVRASLGHGAMASALLEAETSVRLSNPQDPNAPAYLSGLALVLTELGQHEQASHTLRRAVSSSPRMSPSRDLYRVNLAASLRDEWKAGGRKTTLHEAIRILTRLPHSGAPWAHLGAVILGDCLRARNAPGDHVAAARCYADVHENPQAPAWLRLLAARSAADAVASVASTTKAPTDWSMAAESYLRAISLHEQAAWHGLAWPSRQRFLSAHANMGTDSAASVLQIGDEPGEALTRLEAGRAILWRGRARRRIAGNESQQVVRLRQIADELDALDHRGIASTTHRLS